LAGHASRSTTDVEATGVGVAATNQGGVTASQTGRSTLNVDPSNEEKRKVLVICTLDDEPESFCFVKSKYMMTDDFFTLFY